MCRSVREAPDAVVVGQADVHHQLFLPDLALLGVTIAAVALGGGFCDVWQQIR